MKVRLLSPAGSELAEAIAYYEGQQRGLGVEFAHDFARTLERIAQYPCAWAAVTTRARRCQMRKFPYGVAYEVRGEEVVVIAVAHLHRGPRFWLARLRADGE